MFNWPRNSNSACDYPRCGCVGTCEGKSRSIIQTTATDHTSMPEPKGAEVHVRLALNCLEELEPEAMRRKARTVRNFNEHSERESQLSAARVALDQALTILAG